MSDPGDDQARTADLELGPDGERLSFRQPTTVEGGAVAAARVLGQPLAVSSFDDEVPTRHGRHGHDDVILHVATYGQAGREQPVDRRRIIARGVERQFDQVTALSQTMLRQSRVRIGYGDRARRMPTLARTNTAGSFQPRLAARELRASSSQPPPR